MWCMTVIYYCGEVLVVKGMILLADAVVSVI